MLLTMGFQMVGPLALKTSCFDNTQPVGLG